MRNPLTHALYVASVFSRCVLHAYFYTHFILSVWVLWSVRLFCLHCLYHISFTQSFLKRIYPGQRVGVTSG